MKHLKELRQKKGITQEICAHLLGHQKTVWLRWEHEEFEPNFAHAMEIAQFFGVSLDYLAGFTDDPKPRP